MRYIGKYEKDPPVQKHVSPGLQTYFISLLSLLLCVTMFYGTTFAWFTSDVVNSGNELYIGTLEADLLLDDVSLKEHPDEKVFDANIPWQPGHMAQRTLSVDNNGDLPFRYELTFVKDNATTDADMAAIAACFEVYIFSNPPAAGASITDIRAQAQAVSLTQIMAGAPLLSGELNKDETHAITVVLYMNENTTADASIMGKSLKLSVKLTAWQSTMERVAASTQSDFASAVSGSNANTVIDLAAGEYKLPAMSGKDVSISGDENTVIDVSYAAGVSGSSIDFKGITIKGADDGFEKGIQHSDVVTYTDCIIEGSMSLYGERVVFKNCTFDLSATANYIWTYGAKEVIFDNCIFNTMGKAILIYNEGADLVSHVAVTNCTFNATGKAYAGTISNQPCAAIEIDSSLVTSYSLTTYNNTYNNSFFSGEWRIKKSNGNNVTVNGTAYGMVTVDGTGYTLNGTTVTQ